MNRLILALLLALPIHAVWQTLYLYADGLAYLQLANNDLLKLKFSIDGSFTADSTYTQGQQVEALASPPEHSTPFLVGSTLYVLHSDARGRLAVSQYDPEEDKWNQSHEPDFTTIGDSKYYSGCSVMAVPGDNNTVYVYGGDLPDSDLVSGRLLSLDLDVLRFNNITTATKPQPFAGAAVVMAPNPQTNLVIGGQLRLGWLNMYQVATWDFAVGWSFKQVEKDALAKVALRRDALALPVFNKTTPSKWDSEFAVLEVVLLGGELMGKPLVPLVAKLAMALNVWTWSNTSLPQPFSKPFVGAATIFNTLVTIVDDDDKKDNNKDGDSKDNEKRGSTGQSRLARALASPWWRLGRRWLLESEPLAKRGKNYKLALYDTSLFEPVDSVALNYAKTAGPTAEAQKLAKQTKVLLGTIVPILALGALALVTLAVWRHRKQRQHDQLADVDSYQFDYYAELKLDPFELRPLQLMLTLDDDDGALFNLWMRKRQQYEMLHPGATADTVVPHRASYLASNDTLDDEDRLEPLPVPKPTHHARTRPIHKLFSFNGGLPDVLATRRVDRSDSRGLDPDANVDVQVLVLLKRRLVLRVVNPDRDALGLTQALDLADRPLSCVVEDDLLVRTLEGSDQLKLEHADDGPSRGSTVVSTSTRGSGASLLLSRASSVRLSPFDNPLEEIGSVYNHSRFGTIKRLSKLASYAPVRVMSLDLAEAPLLETEPQYEEMVSPPDTELEYLEWEPSRASTMMSKRTVSTGRRTPLARQRVALGREDE